MQILSRPHRCRVLKRTAAILAALVTMLAVPNAVLATTIIDTGAVPSNPAPGLTLGRTSESFQNLAGKFTLSGPTTITSVKGWIAEEESAGNLRIAIGTSPGDALYSGVYAGIGGSGLSQWTGLTGLGWSLEAGDYWVSFLAEEGFQGWMSWGVPHPLSAYANQVSDGDKAGAWSALEAPYQLGVRIEAADRAPDGGSMIAMCGLVFAGIIVLTRKR